jgi:signal transduction histidine kinase
MSLGRNLTLRSRLLLLVLLGVVLPLGILGLVVNYSAQRTGVNLVEDRIQEALVETVAEFGKQWVRRRSVLLDLTETKAVLGALDGSGPWVGPLQGTDREDLASIWAQVAPFLFYLELRNPEGERVGRLPDALGTNGPGQFRPTGGLDYSFPVRERFSGDELGSVEVRLRVESLLPAGFLALGVAGSVPGIFDSRSGVPLAPLAMEPDLFSRPEFQWRGERWVARELDMEDPPLRFALATPIEPITAPFDRAAQRGFWAIVFAIAISIALVSTFSSRLTRPLDDLAGAAKAVAAGDLSAKARESGPPGIRETARAFNAMSSTLSRTLKELSEKESIAAVGAFAADLAHEVRNPLTAIRTDLQRAQRKMGSDLDTAGVLVERAVGSVDRLNSTVGDFLRVARSGTVTLLPMDLRDSLKAAILASEPQRQSKGCVLSHELGSQPLMVWGDRDALERLVLNLLLNSVEAVEAGTPMGMRVLSTGEKGRVQVEIWDRGPGIPTEIRDTLFDPFVSMKESGTGLGLAISRRIARGHGSDLEVGSISGETSFSFNLKVARG